MAMDAAAVGMQVRMNKEVVPGSSRPILKARQSAPGCARSKDMPHDTADAGNAKQHEYECDDQVQRKTKPQGYGYSEKNDCAAGDHYGCSVAEAPCKSYPGSSRNPMLPAEDGGDSNYVIWISGMTHPQHQAQQCHPERRTVHERHDPAGAWV